MNQKLNHKIISILIAGVFYATMLLPVSPVMLMVISFAEILVAAIYNFIYLHKEKSFYWSAARFLFLQLALLGISLVLPNAFRPYLLFLCCIVLFAAEYTVAAVSEQLLLLETILTFFGLCLAVFAVWFYFLPSSTYVLLSIFIFSVLVCRAAFDLIPRSEYEKMFYSFLVAFCVSEISWGLLLMPLHFSALAIISFNALYVLWILAYYKLYNNISGKKISFHLVLALILVIIAIASTPWR